MKRRVLLLSGGAAGLLSGCASPRQRLYTLAPVPGVPQGGGPAVVALHQVAVARYLERPGIVASSENYRLGVMANDVWGEPIAQMIGRVLAEDLTQRMPGSTFISVNGAITTQEDATVEVNVLRMDIDASGALAFSAQTAVEFTHGPQETRSLTTTVPLGGPGIAEEVRSISIALGQLADIIATMLRRPAAARRRG